MEKELQELTEYIVNELPSSIKATHEFSCDCLVITVPVEHIVNVLNFLRDDPRTQFKVLTDLTAVDYPQRDRRFEIIYNLLSLKYNIRMRVKTIVDEDTLVPTASSLFSVANWYEREVWDMYGVKFSDHPDLRRILTDYGFHGHPQRKDFPLTGYVEMRYDHEQKKVVYEPVKLDQAYRSFDFLSPWEGTEYNLPGDEKATANNDEDQGAENG